ncbi:MAG: histidinol dehydrogenase, partial [Oceanospirillaceae bacterium]|nr:histidinol dehydrogenase [Oceanospirillaceae bacterium]
MSALNIKRIDANAASFSDELTQLLAWESVSDAKVNKIVDDILNDVRDRGDAAVIEYTNKFDNTSASSMADLTLSNEQLQ